MFEIVFVIKCPLNLNVGLSIGYEQARSGGIIWQLIGDFKPDRKGLPYVLGVGGRYDYLLSEFQ